MKTTIAFFSVILLLLISSGVLTILDSTKIDKVGPCKVVELQQQQLIKEKTTEIRYLVITDKETFVCESSLINGKFNNSDLFYHLKKDSTYTFKVCGFGKGPATDYRNILEIY